MPQKLDWNDLLPPTSSNTLIPQLHIFKEESDQSVKNESDQNDIVLNLSTRQIREKIRRVKSTLNSSFVLQNLPDGGAKLRFNLVDLQDELDRREKSESEPKEIGKEAREFKFQPSQFKEKLDYPFNDITATGAYSYTPSSGVLPNSDPDDVVEETQWQREQADLRKNILRETPPTPIEEFQPSQIPCPQNPEKGNKKIKRPSYVAEWQNNVTCILDCFEKRTKKSLSSSPNVTQPSSYFNPALNQVLLQIQEFPLFKDNEDLYTEAVEVMENEKNIGIFNAIPGDGRKQNWLKKKVQQLRGTSNNVNNSNFI